MEYNKVAAKWWADKLRNVGPRNFDMGESGEVGLHRKRKFLQMDFRGKLQCGLKKVRYL